MNKLKLCLCVIMLLTLCLTACSSSDKEGQGQNNPSQSSEGSSAVGDTGNNNSNSSSANDSQASSNNTAAASHAGGSFDGYAFPEGRIDIYVDMPMSDVLAALGDADEYFESKSCAFDGLDKTYTYKHFEIITYPQNGVDYVSSIYLFDDVLTTKEGLYIGSKKDSMESLYGTSYTQNGSEYIYAKGGMELRIILTDDKVTSITYTSTVTKVLE